MRKKLLIAALSITTAISAAAQSGQWSYGGKTGPDRWAKLSSDYLTCTNGSRQSPIDIRGAKPANLPPLEFHYLAGNITLINDGRTITGKVEPGSYLSVNGHRYDLVQFQFHSPSEEAVKGQLSDMEVQLLHKDSNGKMAVISVRMKEGARNVILAALWPLLPKQAGQSATSTNLIGTAGLLPPDRSYWAYDGSLSTPPCTEDVRWFVFKQEAELSRDQLQTLQALYPRNARPLQAPHDRKIEASK